LGEESGGVLDHLPNDLRFILFGESRSLFGLAGLMNVECFATSPSAVR
jgi:hypothetical protein